jgi:hypothetical protein
MRSLNNSLSHKARCILHRQEHKEKLWQHCRDFDYAMIDLPITDY